LVERKRLSISLFKYRTDVKLFKLTGVEGLSRSFEFKLCLAADQPLDKNSLLGDAISFCIDGDQAGRVINGRVMAVNLMTPEFGFNFCYELILAPWFDLLKQHVDCRIFQDKSVIDIARFYFDYFGCHDYDFSKLIHKYPKIKYCVQYNESVTDFIERLLSENGIFYYYHFHAEGHTLVLADSIAVYYHHRGRYSVGVRADHHVRNLNIKYEPNPMKIKVVSTLTLTSKQSISHKISLGDKYPQQQVDRKIFLNPVSSDKILASKALLAQKRARQDAELIEFVSNISGLALADVIQLDSVYEHDLLIVHLEHDYFDDSCLLNTRFEQDSVTRNKAIAIPAYKCFVANELLKPVFSGVHTAVVTGVDDKAIHTDELGRVKLRFHWDRYAKNDSSSSCWVSVVQGWGDQNVGMDFTPRVGHEVLVKYEGGDLDYPVVIGSVHNSVNKVVAEGLNCVAECVIKTNSMPNDDGDGNMIRLDSQPGAQKLLFSAKRNLESVINGTRDITTVRDYMCEVGRNAYININKGKHSTVAHDKILLQAGDNSILLHAGGVDVNASRVSFNSEVEAFDHIAEAINIQPDTDQKLESHEQYPRIRSIAVAPKWRKIVAGYDENTLTRLLRLEDSTMEFPLLDEMIQKTMDKRFLQLSNDPTEQKLKTHLQIDNPSNLRDGYIYVFAKATNSPDGSYSKIRLFKEFQIIHRAEAGRVGMYEVDLSIEAGKDQRVELMFDDVHGNAAQSEVGDAVDAESLQQTAAKSQQEDDHSEGPVHSDPSIELPYCYCLDENGNEQGLFDVYVFYSSVQLSWPRLQRLGGMDPNDKRLKNPNLTPEQKKKIAAAASYPCCEALQTQRWGQQLPAELLQSVYQQQYQSGPGLPLSKAKNTDKVAAWGELSVYQSDATNEFPYLLLSDPVGMIIEANIAIDYCRRKLVGVMNKISNDNSIEMKTALFAFHMFYKLRCNNIETFANSGASHSKNEDIESKVAAFNHVTQVREYLDINKIKKYLLHDERTAIKQVLNYYQKIVVALVERDGTGYSSWGNSLTAAMLDRFAHKGHAYAQAFNDLAGLLGMSCFYPADLDESFEADLLPANTVQASTTGIFFKDVVNIDEYAYIRRGFSIYKSHRVYNGDQMEKYKQISYEICSTLESPPGHQYLCKNFHNSILFKTIFPDVMAGQQPDKEAGYEIYMDATGIYNPSALVEAQEVVATALSTEDEADVAKSLAKDNDHKYKKLIKKSFSLIDKFLTFFSTQSIRMGEPYAKIAFTFRRMAVALTVDSLSIKRADVSVDVLVKGDDRELFAQQMLFRGKQQMDQLLSSQEEEFADDVSHVFVLKGSQIDEQLTHGEKGDYFTQDIKLATSKLRQSQSRFDQEATAMLAKYSSFQPHALKVSKSLRASRLACSSAFFIFSLFDLQKQMDSMDDEFSVNTLGNIILDVKSLVEKSVKFTSLLAGFFGRSDEFDNFINQTYVRISDAVPALSKLNIKLGVLGLYEGMASLCKDVGTISSDWSKHDPLLDIGNALTITGDVMISLTSTMTLLKASSDAEILTKGLLVKAADRVAALEAIEVVGLAIPFIDVIALIALAVQLIAWFCFSNKRTEYENWARNSILAKDELSTVDVKQSYLTLLDFFNHPDMQVVDDHDADAKRAVCKNGLLRFTPGMKVTIEPYYAYYYTPQVFTKEVCTMLPSTEPFRKLYDGVGMPSRRGSQSGLNHIGFTQLIDTHVHSDFSVNRAARYVAQKAHAEGGVDDIWWASSFLSHAIQIDYYFRCVSYFPGADGDMLSLPIKDANADATTLSGLSDFWGWSATAVMVQSDTQLFPASMQWSQSSYVATPAAESFAAKVRNRARQLLSSGEYAQQDGKQSVSYGCEIVLKDSYSEAGNRVFFVKDDHG
jgi:type VI secretion system secreted protein VgrG